MYNKWVFNPFQDLLLVFNMIDVLALNNFSLLHALDSKFMVRLCFKPTNSDVSEGTYNITSLFRISKDTQKQEA